MRRTAFFSKEICFWHDPGPSGPFDKPGGFIQPLPAAEHPETKRRIRNLLDVSGLLEQLQQPRSTPARREDLERFHTTRYLDWLEAESAKGFGDGGECAPFRQDAYQIACHSAGLAIDALRAVLKGEADNAYALTRPPSHHAERDRGRGFCLIGNIPVAIETARAEGLVRRVAVVDWDVHHGNGTEQAFYDNGEVLTISLHHANNYPVDSGDASDRGEGAGLGYNLNVPLPPGCGGGAYREVFERLVLPALERFQPELIVVACGFDAAAFDPLGTMLLSSADYAWMTGQLLAAAERLCGGRLVMTHEGGYSEGYVPFCAQAVRETLSGISTEVRDPVLEDLQRWGGQDLQPHQKALIDSLVPHLDAIKAG